METGRAGRLIGLGQRIARAQKTSCGVERVAVLLTTACPRPCVPMMEKTDINSRRYVEEESLTFRPLPPTDMREHEAIAAELRAGL